ncbi:hypothetical protein ACP4OV_009848 [Aristida adscensionis]
MGLKLSCIKRGGHSRQVHRPASPSPSPARVIAADGSLKELPASRHVSVSDVLGADEASTPLFFVCNSDALYFDEPPPALGPGEPLRPGQIYFVLPAAMLARPLSSADMAALAVRASAALASSSGTPRRRARGRRPGGESKKKVSVTPVRDEDGEGDVEFFNEKLNEQTLGQFGAALLRPAKSSEKLAAAAVAAAARTQLKRALSIIQEDAD